MGLLSFPPPARTVEGLKRQCAEMERQLRITRLLVLATFGGALAGIIALATIHWLRVL